MPGMAAVTFLSCERPLEGCLVRADRAQRIGCVAAGLGLHGHDADAGLGGAGDRILYIVAASEVILHEGHVEELVLVVHEGVDDFRLVGVGRHAEEADLSLLLELHEGFAHLGLENPLAAGDVVELDDVDVIPSPARWRLVSTSRTMSSFDRELERIFVAT